MSMTVAPGTINSPLCLVIYTGGASTAEGKLRIRNGARNGWRYARQSAEARGGSGDNDGSGAV